MRSSKPITVTLDAEQTGSIDRRLASGQYASASEVIQAGLRALDREEEFFGRLIADKVRSAFASSEPDLDAKEVFARVRAAMQPGASKDSSAVEKIDRKARFLEDMERFNWSMPEGFDRDEANER